MWLAIAFWENRIVTICILCIRNWRKVWMQMSSCSEMAFFFFFFCNIMLELWRNVLSYTTAIEGEGCVCGCECVRGRDRRLKVINRNWYYNIDSHFFSHPQNAITQTTKKILQDSNRYEQKLFHWIQKQHIRKISRANVSFGTLSWYNSWCIFYEPLKQYNS